MKNPIKILIIRFSSFGDIIQNLTAVDHLSHKYPEAEIHWITREDFAELVGTHPDLKKVWSFKRQSGLKGLIQLAKRLQSENFTHIYDSHSNVRSHILSWILRYSRTKKNGHFIRRSKQRFKRWLLFYWHWNLFSWPYYGAQSYIWPLKKWGIQWNSKLPRTLQLPKLKEETKNILKWAPSESWVLAPSAAWEMKRWPVTHWQNLIIQLPHHRFFVLGGVQDHFCKQLEQVAPNRVQNLAGLLSWLESGRLVSQCRGLVSGDTGVLHLGDYTGCPTWAIIGPTAFGFPSWPNSHAISVDLPCRPCSKDGRGKCRLKKQPKKCLLDISPEKVASEINRKTSLLRN